MKRTLRILSAMIGIGLTTTTAFAADDFQPFQPEDDAALEARLKQFNAELEYAKAERQRWIDKRTDPVYAGVEYVYGEALPYSLPRRIAYIKPMIDKETGRVQALRSRIERNVSELDRKTAGAYSLRDKFSSLDEELQRAFGRVTGDEFAPPSLRSAQRETIEANIGPELLKLSQQILVFTNALDEIAYDHPTGGIHKLAVETRNWILAPGGSPSLPEEMLRLAKHQILTARARDAMADLNQLDRLNQFDWYPRAVDQLARLRTLVPLPPSVQHHE